MMVTKITLSITIVSFIMAIASVIKLIYTNDHEGIFKWRMIFWLLAILACVTGFLTVIFYFLKI